jgi:tetratricopeptide (TPR) repeat protein
LSNVSKAKKPTRSHKSASSGGGAGASKPAPAKSVRLNVRALVVLAALILLAVPCFFALKAYQTRSSRETYLSEATRLAGENRPDLAIGYVNRYLEFEPTNLEALDLKSRMLAEVARDPAAVKAATQAHLQLLSADATRQPARKRLIALYLKSQTYQAAEIAAREYIKRGGDDAEAHRLLAHALEGIGVAGDSKALDQAIAEYETAEAKQPGDVVGAERLAYLYRTKANDPVKAQLVMDSLLRFNPNSVPARLARFRFFIGLGNPEASRKASAEIDEALKLAPTDLTARLIAAEAAAQRGDVAAARRHISAIDPLPKNDLRVSLVEGLIELTEQRTDEAIQSWRSGLVQTGGADPDLTWRLAHVLLQLGRFREAEPLMSQYRRLTGGTEPTPEYRYLVALSHMRMGRTGEAVAELEAIRFRIDKALEGQLYLALGRGYEQMRDETKALEAYQKASTFTAVGAPPWLAMARLLIANRPDEAIDTLERGLVSLPEDPRLLANLAQVVWQRENAKPKDRRNWDDFTRVLSRTEKVAPDAVETTLVKADYLGSSGRLDEALALLNNASSKNPKATNLWLAQINAQSRLGRTDQAMQLIDVATKAAGESASLRSSKAYLYLLRGETKSARTTLVEGLDRVPADQRPAIWKALGEFYQGQNDTLSARKAYGEWANLQTDAAEPRLALLNLAIATGDTPAMASEVDALKKIGGTSSLYWKIARAEFLLHPKAPTTGSKDPAEAARLEETSLLVKEIKAAIPRQPAGHVLEARLLERRDRSDDAIRSYQAALDLSGGQIALRPLVVLLTRLRRTDDLEALRKKVPAFPAEIERLSGALTLQLGDNARAELMAKKMVEGDPQSLDARVWQARVLNTLGKPKEAEESLKLLTQQRPSEPGPWLQLLMFQISQKELPAASATVDLMKTKVKTERPELLWAICYRVLGKQDLADGAFAEALKKWPDDHRVRQAAIDYFEVTNRPELAERSLRHVLKSSPNVDWARRKLVLLLSARANDLAAWNEANSLAGESSDGSDTPDDRILRATVLSRSPQLGHRQEAIQLLEALSAEVPGSTKLHEVLSRVLLQDGQRARAKDHAARAAEADAAPAEAILFHASFLLEDKDVAEAEKQLRRLIAIDPTALPTIELNARILTAKGQGDEAAKELEKAFEAHKSAPDALPVGLGILQLMMILRQDAAAERLGGELARLSPKGRVAFAEFLAARNRPKEAREQLDTAFKAGATAEVVKSAIALSAVGGSSPEWLREADELLAVALKAKPDSVELLQAQAYLRHLQGRYDEEISLYQAILARKPTSYVFMNNMAWTLSEEMNKPDEGLQRADEAIEKMGFEPHVLDTRGVIRTRLRNYPEAIRDLEAAVAAIPSGPIYYHLARAYAGANRTADAEVFRRKAKDAGLTLEQLQPSEREEAARLLGLTPRAPSAPKKP